MNYRNRVTVFVLVIGLGSCAGARPLAPVRAPGHVAAVAVVTAQPDAESPTEAPSRVREAIVTAVERRELKVRTVSRQDLGASFGRLALAADKANAALRAREDADVAVVVELRPRFFSQLAGRYRWEVRAFVTVAARREIALARTEGTAVAVFLEQGHERETEALVAAGPEVGEWVGRTVDSFLAGLLF